MDHRDSIIHIKKIIHPEFIEIMLPLINHKAEKNLKVGPAGNLKKDIRNAKGYSLDFDTPTNLFYWNFVKQEIERLYIFYRSQFPKMLSNKINQIDLLKYNVGGKYEVHTDQYTTSPRALSIIMNLNDDYEGGDLIFTDQKDIEIKRLKLEKGSIVFFPSNFMYPHKIDSITKGTRYSIVAWLQ
jgi:predicted 2-oxoglutarate/Fe(II)-dependent dioxygenase YbiX